MLRRFALAAVVLCVFPRFADAGDAWLDERFDMVVRDQSVRSVLTEFGGIAGVPTVVSDAVQDTVSARFEAATGREILDAVSGRYGLDWRFDGRRLEITAHEEQVRRVLDMGGVDVSTLVAALRSLGAYDPKYPISSFEQSLSMVSGPPAYVAIVEVVLAELVERRAVGEQIAAAREVELEQVLAEERERVRQEAERRDAETRQIAAEQAAEARRLAAEARKEAASRAAEARKLAVAREVEEMRLRSMREQAEIQRAQQEVFRLQEALERERQRALRGPVVIRGGVYGG